MALSALIFDVDGTLVDSNQAHVDAWETALKQNGYSVSPDRIAVEIGKGGDKLVPSILGQQIEKRDGKKLRKAHTAKFTKLAESRGLSPFPGILDLLAELRRRGLKLAVATSSKKDELGTLERSANLDLRSHFDVVATSDDADESKPAPDLVEVAAEKLRMSPAQCAMVGDTPYDAQTSRDAGVVCLGVTCGGMNDAKTLRGSGMRKVYRDPADMAERIDDVLRVASPGSAVLTQDLIESLMREALAAAKEGLERGEVPIGSVIARGDGMVIARGHNELNASQNKTAHAEMVTFNRTAGKLPTDARDLILVSTLEPCVMCLGAAMEAAVDAILFGLNAPTDGGRKRVSPPVSPESQMPRILGNVLAADSRKLLEQFLKRSPANPMQAKFVRQLLVLEKD
jgi:HAD superfamily hydrolase (TIGR01509 family)